MTKEIDEKIEAAKKHLSDYKKDVLKVQGCGEWNGKQYSHILPESEKTKNLIANTISEDTLFSFIKEEKIHEGFSHLNSSQALALNLFGALLEKQKLDLLLECIPHEIEIGNINYAKCEFEHIEDTKEETQFDFFVSAQNANIYFEVKYSENFSGEKIDSAHQEKYETIYKQKLEKVAQGLSKEEFFENYQIWRNIIYSPTGLCVFVFPKFRSDLEENLKSQIAKANAQTQSRIKIVYIDDIVQKCILDSALKNHYAEFKKKYLDF